MEENLKLKSEDFSLNEIQFFCDSVANRELAQFRDTLDYFDSSFGILLNKESPSALEFSIALLNEVLCHLKPGHEMWDKIKYGTFILYLASRDMEFNVLYQVFHQVELEVSSANMFWNDAKVSSLFEDQMVEKLLVKDDLSQLEEEEGEVFNSKTQYDETDSQYVENDLKQDKENNLEDFSGFDNDNCAIDDQEEDVKNDATILQETENSDSKSNIKKKGRPKKRTATNAKLVKAEKEDQKAAKKIRKKEKLEAYQAKREKKKPLKCAQCDFRAKFQFTLDKHAFKHHKTTRLCTQCGHMSNTFEEFTQHDKTHVMTCEICNISILGSRAFKQHMSKRHDDKKFKVPCDMCGALLQEKSLKVHMATVHGTNTFKCDLCDFTAKGKYNLKKHMRFHFKKPQKCPECGKVLKNMAKHFRESCSRPRERYKCDMCDKDMSTKHGLSRHIKNIHHKITDVHCQMCDYKTTDIYHLRVHVSLKHKKESLVNFIKVCRYCNKKTGNMDYHLKIYHYEEYMKTKSYGEETKMENKAEFENVS